MLFTFLHAVLDFEHRLAWPFLQLGLSTTVFYDIIRHSSAIFRYLEMHGMYVDILPQESAIHMLNFGSFFDLKASYRLSYQWSACVSGIANDSACVSLLYFRVSLLKRSQIMVLLIKLSCLEVTTLVLHIHDRKRAVSKIELKKTNSGAWSRHTEARENNALALAISRASYAARYSRSERNDPIACCA